MSPRLRRPQTPNAQSVQKGPDGADSTRLRLMIVRGGALLDRELTQALAAHGFSFEAVPNHHDALADARARRYDAILVNADADTIDALRLCIALRAQGSLSVLIVVGTKPSVAAQLEAFRAGATDRVEHGMPREALVERILALVAGARIKATGLLYPVTAELPTRAGVFTMCLVPTLIRVNEQPISFSRIEERLFARLWIGRAAPVPREELMASAWLERKVPAATLKTHMYQLRRKLGKLGLAIEHADGGYRFVHS